MKYRKFGKLDFQSSVLGFGAMRLPQFDSNPANVNEDESIRMIRYAIDQGVNYVDTAYPYHMGQSEITVGKALRDGYRDKVKVATKLPPWRVRAPEDFDRHLNEQFERLQVDTIDFYLLHGLNKIFWRRLYDMDVIRWAEKAIIDGRIGHLGFSFHDDFGAFKEIVDAYDNWTFCQIQYNFMDIDYQAGTRGLHYAASKGLAIVVMEPLRGGRLTNKVPTEVHNLWKSAPQIRTPAEWGLLWVWNHPEISMALSGMTKMEHVEENVDIAENSGSNILSSQELALIEQVRDAYQKLYPISCTNCSYCMPCSHKIDIPRIFEIYNDAIAYNDTTSARMYYGMIKKERQADQCQDCRECAEVCPQQISIPEWLQKAHALLSPGK
jgi:predicted aldo/keto reductase-like oxidoreductase